MTQLCVVQPFNSLHLVVNVSLDAAFGGYPDSHHLTLSDQCRTGGLSIFMLSGDL